ncbi:MAG: VanZ family protein [Azoarcus sp.]|nr:VanZ family protein [Azoarcus sp.]
MSSIRSLPRHLAIAYAALLVYACLHPLSGWQSSGLPVFDYLIAPWPKYFSVDDLILNIAGYIPLGLTIASALPRGWSKKRGIAATVLFAALLSFCLETIQGFLPTRTASNIDIAANTVGACIGALAGAHWRQVLFAPQRGIARWRARHITDGLTGDAGLILLALWLLAQITPDHLLFAGGDLRRLLGIAPPLPFQAGRLIAFEAMQTASIMLAVGLFARCILRVAGPFWAIMLLLLGIGARTLASALFFVPSDPLAWLTPGTGRGLIAGSLLLIAALRLSRVAQHSLAGASLLVSTALINLMPESPYFLDNDHAILNRGNYPNFYGLSHLVAALWPLAALAYLSAFGLWQGERLENRHDHHGHP